MKTSARAYRTTAYLLSVLLISAGLAACGGGGGGSTSPGTSGPATVSVSMASATSYPDGTTFAASTSSPTPAARSGSPEFVNVFVTVTKLALIPSTGPEFPDPNGEVEKTDSTDKDGNGFVSATLDSPLEIDLMNLSGDNAAMLLNKFSGVPAGTYSKIRVYYDNVVGAKADNTLVPFHQTANYHFDVHFVGGNLVIPVTSDPAGGIRFFSVVIDVVGLKITSAGPNVLMRPQVFAKVVGAPKYIVTGVADQVNHSAGTFVVKAVNDNISAAYGSGTNWFYVDGRFVGPFGSSGANALQNTAIVDVIGTFSSDNVLIATEVDITFPDVRQGTADNVWILDNTAFIVRSLTDNVTVFPAPNRTGAYYDNSTSPFIPLTYADIKNGIQVKARGYFNSYPDLDAYWISVGP